MLQYFATILLLDFNQHYLCRHCVSKESMYTIAMYFTPSSSLFSIVSVTVSGTSISGNISDQVCKFIEFNLIWLLTITMYAHGYRLKV